MPVVKPGPKGKGEKVDSRLSISLGKQDGRYPQVTKELDLPIRLLVMRDGRPPHEQVRNLVDKALSKVRGTSASDLSRAVHVWAGKVIALYKYTTLKEMKVNNKFPYLPPPPQNSFSFPVSFKYHPYIYIFFAKTRFYLLFLLLL